MATRECPVAFCEEKVTRDKLMCKHHWFKVPKPVRDEVWRAYREEGVLSEAYLEARAEAIRCAEEQEL